MVALVLAGGLSTRFGGDKEDVKGKQLTAVDEEGHTLLDYALYDAYLAGIDKAIIVVNARNKTQMAQKVGVRIGAKLSVILAEQTPPTVYGFAEGHRPLGTGHAFLCGAQLIKEPFVVLNGDDFYGREAIAQAATLAAEGKYGCIVYKAGQTVGKTRVNRGIALTDKGRLTGICECAFDRDRDGRLYAQDDTCRRYVSESTPVNMNLYAMQPAVTATAAKCFARFLEEGKDSECYLGDIVTEYIGNNHHTVYAQRAESRWYGVTYREDVKSVHAHIRRLRNAGVYPRKLWA